MVASRLVTESAVRLRPRFGRFDSSASRYTRTERPSVRPTASAALCSVDMERVLFFARAEGFFALAVAFRDFLARVGAALGLMRGNLVVIRPDHRDRHDRSIRFMP